MKPLLRAIAFLSIVLAGVLLLWFGFSKSEVKSLSPPAEQRGEPRRESPAAFRSKAIAEETQRLQVASEEERAGGRMATEEKIQEIASFLRRGYAQGERWHFSPEAISHSPEYQQLLAMLEELGPESRRAILALLQEIREERLFCVLLMACGDLKHFESQGLLKRFLQSDDSYDLIEASAYGLSRLGTPDAFEALAKRLEGAETGGLDRTMARYLGFFGKPALETLLRDAERRLRENPGDLDGAHLYLGKIRGGSELSQDLFAIAQAHEEGRIRAMAIHAMGKNGDPENAARLAAILQAETDRGALAATLGALGDLGVEGSDRAVLDFASSQTDAQLIASASRALGQLRSEAAVPHLLRWIEEQDSLVGDEQTKGMSRSAIFRALGSIGGAESAAFLRDRLRVASPEEKDRILSSLGACCQPGTLDPEISRAILEAVGEGSLDEEGFSWALASLRLHGVSTGKAVAAAVSALQSAEDDRSKRSLLMGIGHLRSPEVAEAVRPLTREGNPLLTRVFACEILRRTQEAVPTFSDEVRETERALSRQILDAFEQGEVAQFLLAAPSEQEVHGSVLVDFLGRAGDEGDLQALDRIAIQYKGKPGMEKVANAAFEISQRIRARAKAKE